MLQQHTQFLKDCVGYDILTFTFLTITNSELNAVRQIVVVKKSSFSECLFCQIHNKMKFLMNLVFVILLLGLISTSFGVSQEYCKSSVYERVHLLRNNVEVFKKNVAFDPLDPTKPITKYELYPNGWMS